MVATHLRLKWVRQKFSLIKAPDVLWNVTQSLQHVDTLVYSQRGDSQARDASGSHSQCDA